MIKGERLAAWLVVAAAGASGVTAFVPSTSRLASVNSRRQASVVKATTLVNTPTILDSASEAPMSWDCDDEANCVIVPACDEEVCRTSLDVRIHGEWFDLTG
jgi:hypothetical protein